MNVRRFVLRLAVGLLCFLVGWASAVLLGATARRAPQTRVHSELIVVPRFAPPLPPPPHFELHAHPPCGEMRMPHSHELHAVPHVEDLELHLKQFESELTPPPPPPAPRPRPARR